MQIVVCDTETTGMEPAEGAALLEVAWVVLTDDSGDWDYGTSATHYVRHTGAIPPQAKAVHHIRESDVDAASDAAEREALIHSMLCAEVAGEMMYAFHNAAFDKKFLPELTLPVICTHRSALQLYPEAPSHSNQVLRYWLGVEPPEHLLAGAAPHRALYDAAVTAAVLLRMLQRSTPDELLALTAAPALLRTAKFGKYRGTPWAEVPKDYLRWLLNKSDMVRDDADLRHTVRHHLNLT